MSLKTNEMKQLLLVIIALLSINLASFANDDDKIRTTEDFNLKGKVKSKKCFNNGRLSSELNFRQDGRLISEIQYSTKTGQKDKEERISYDVNGNVLSRIKYDYTLSVIKRSDLPKDAIVPDTTINEIKMWDYAPYYLENKIIYEEKHIYNDKNQEIERVTTFKENDKYNRNKYIFEYDKNGLKTSEKFYDIDLSYKDSSHYKQYVYTYDKNGKTLDCKQYYVKEGKEPRLNQVTSYTYNSKGLLTEKATFSDTTLKAKLTNVYFDNGQLQMVIDCKEKFRRPTAGPKGPKEKPYVYICDTTEIYDQKGRKLLYKSHLRGVDNVLKYVYDKKNNLVDEYNLWGHRHHSYTKKGIKTESRKFSIDSKSGEEKLLSVTTYDNEGRVIKIAYEDGDYVTISYDEKGFGKLEQSSCAHSMTHYQFGQYLIENRLMDYKDRTKEKEIYTYEYDDKKNLIKTISGYMRESRYMIEYYE